MGEPFVLGGERQPCCVCHIIFQRLFSFLDPHSQLVGVGALFRLTQALGKRSGLANRRCHVWNGYQVLHIFEPFARGKIARLRIRMHHCGHSFACSPFHICAESMLHSTYPSGQLMVCFKSNTAGCISISVALYFEIPFYTLGRKYTQKPPEEFAALSFAGLFPIAS